MRSDAVAAASALMLLSACAIGPQDIPAESVSPATYDSFSCEQLAAEAERVSARATALASGEVPPASGKPATSVDMVFPFPLVFVVKAESPAAAEIGRLKGEMNAIEQASHARKCSITFRRA
jgi:hypothetical protein